MATTSMVSPETQEVLTQIREALKQIKPEQPPPPGDPTRDPVTPDERQLLQLLNAGGVEEKLNFLLGDAIETERESQRDDDTNYDHGIRLMSRQKFQTWKRVIFVFLFLNWIYGVQLVVEYNLSHSVGKVSANTMSRWVELKEWTNPRIVPFPTVPNEIENAIRDSFGGSVVAYDQLYDLGWCLTSTGKYSAAFNVGIGIIISFLFIFGDLFNVVFDMPLVRSFPTEKRGVFMLLANLWMVALNAAVLTWLGIIAGESVNANSSDFFQIINTALSVFIVVAIDNEVLPAIRFVAEEFGFMNYRGMMSSHQLERLTFGQQYYKPGYGHNWIHKLHNAPNPALKVLPVVLLVAVLAIIITPGAITSYRAYNYLVPCS